MVRTLTVALLVVALASVSTATILQNGNFDDAGPPPSGTTGLSKPIPNWTVTSDESLLLPDSAQSGVFYVFGDIEADTEEMVMISNWPDGGSHGSTDITKLISDAFDVTGDRKWIEFDYVYVTQEPTDGNFDPFQVSIVLASTEEVLLSEVVTSAFDPRLVDSLEVDGAPFLDPDGHTNRQSPGWTHYKVDILPFAGQTVRLIFTISDTNNDLVNSGVFLENVEQTPEPATIVFFGLGALGLGYAVRRRRRTAK